MACFSDGTTLGTVGGGAIEHNAMLKSRELNSDTVCFNKKYTLNHADAEKLGMVCGGEVEINFNFVKTCKRSVELFEKISNAVDEHKNAWLITNTKSGELSLYCKGEGYLWTESQADLRALFKNDAVLSADRLFYVEPLSKDGVVYVFGGGHVSKALCPILSSTDFRVVVYEDNELFARKELFPDAEKVICADFTAINDNIKIESCDYAVVLTRGHKSDNEVVRQILSKHPSYLGVIGSRKKVSFMRDFLLQCGFDEKDINEIHSPVGIEIGAVTPAEIAVSITAQLIKHRAGKA